MELLGGLRRDLRFRDQLLGFGEVLLNLADLGVDHGDEVLAVLLPALEVRVIRLHGVQDARLHHFQGLHGVAAQGVRVLAAVACDQVEIIIVLKSFSMKFIKLGSMIVDVVRALLPPLHVRLPSLLQALDALGEVLKSGGLNSRPCCSCHRWIVFGAAHALARQARVRRRSHGARRGTSIAAD